ncbi:endonuclease Q family protein [Bacillus timonensis]|nr:endonuclease Q family protein [Bacillus timonensis]
MNNYFVDLHIHIGRTASGKPVKITGAKSLTIENILIESTEVKGMDMIGVIDCHVPEIQFELKQMIKQGKVIELNGGGIRYKNVTLILGTELEIYDEHCKGPIHILGYLPNLVQMELFSKWLSQRMKNVTLSSQRIYESGVNIQRKIKELGGLFVPAHVFTPYKSLYGRGVERSLSEVLNPELIDGIELGLSANTLMADQIAELHQYSFLSNSDAHSLPKIAREYQIMRMKEPTFEELQLALHKRGNRYITSNYGLDPLLGKYHKTTCEKCGNVVSKSHLLKCGVCDSEKIVKGVFDRLNELKDTKDKNPNRPPYIHQVPLEFIPGIGPKTLKKLRDYFKTEMDILHRIPEESLLPVVGSKITALIMEAREGKIKIQPGGGGVYGKIQG